MYSLLIDLRHIEHLSPLYILSNVIFGVFHYLIVFYVILSVLLLLKVVYVMASIFHPLITIYCISNLYLFYPLKDIDLPVKGVLYLFKQ